MAITKEILTVDNNKQPSQELAHKIKQLVSGFKKLKIIIEEIFTLGRAQGYNDLQIASLIKQEAQRSGLSNRNIRRYLPQTARHVEFTRKSFNGDSDTKEDKKSTYTDTDTDIGEIELERPESYHSADLDRYSKQTLIEIIRWYESQHTVKQVVGLVKTLEPTTITTIPAKNYYSPQQSTDSPRQQTVNECLRILESNKSAMSFTSLVEQASNSNSIVCDYLGGNFLTKTNFKLRPVLEVLLNHDNIKRVEGQKQITLVYQE